MQAAVSFPKKKSHLPTICFRKVAVPAPQAARVLVTLCPTVIVDEPTCPLDLDAPSSWQLHQCCRHFMAIRSRAGSMWCGIMGTKPSRVGLKLSESLVFILNTCLWLVFKSGLPYSYQIHEWMVSRELPQRNLLV